MKKLFFYLAMLVSFCATAQYTPRTDLNYPKFLKVLPDGALTSDYYFCLYNNADKFMYKISAASVNPNLQVVTDNGNSTTNSIISSNGATTSKMNPDGTVETLHSSGQFAKMEATGGIRLNQGGSGFQTGLIRSAFGSAGISNAVLPDFVGTYTLGRGITFNGTTTSFGSDGLADFGANPFGDIYIPLAGNWDGAFSVADQPNPITGILYYHDSGTGSYSTTSGTAGQWFDSTGFINSTIAFNYMGVRDAFAGETKLFSTSFNWFDSSNAACGGFNWDLTPGTGTIHIPSVANTNRYLPLKVNGNYADSAGNITISAGGANLSYTASSTDGLVNSDTGSSATIPLANGTNAGLMKPADFTKLGGIVSGATAYTDEMAQDAVGNGFDSTLIYNDGANSFGRAGITGDIIIGTGSNTAAIGTGVIVNADINAAANIDATKLGTGIINTTELNYIDGATSNLQTQINGKQNTITPAALTKTDDTNVTLTYTGTPLTSLLQAVNIAVGWTGTLPDSRISSAAVWNAKEDSSNKSTTTTLGTSNALYPTQNAVKVYADTKQTKRWVTPDDYGAVGNGTTDDATALQAAMSSGFNVWIPSKTYLTNTTITIPSNIHITGDGVLSRITTNANIAMFELQGNDILIDGLGFLGGATTTNTAQYGIAAIGNVGFTLYRLRNIITNCTFTNVRGAGVYGINIIGNSSGSEHQGCYNISNCEFTGNRIGVFLNTRMEYNMISNCNFTKSTVSGIWFVGGNNNVVGGSIVDGTLAGVTLQSGANDGHSSIVGTKINHNTTNINCSHGLGFVFSACTIYTGDITLTGTGKTVFDACQFGGAYMLTITNSPVTFAHSEFAVLATTYNLTGTSPLMLDSYFGTGRLITPVLVGSSAINSATLSKTANYTVTLADFGKNGQLDLFCDATTATFTVIFPSAASMAGYQVNIIKTDASANSVVLDANGTELINQSATYPLTAINQSAILKSNSTGLYIF